MQAQVNKLEAIPTWELVERPPGAIVLPGKWVYDIKCDLDNNVKDFQACWVACGNFQKDFDDNIETYAPVIVDIFVKMFLTKVIHQGKEVVQFDMVMAYLNALIQQKQVFVKQPTGFEKAGLLDLVSMLLRAIYGLRELANLWNKMFQDVLVKKMGLQEIDEEPCFFYCPRR
jgi:hypothetical protein